MTFDEAMKKLESLGSEQTRKTYRRHGMKDPIFGVKYGDLAKAVKALKVDHALAKQLWASGNGDARVLAAMIADPRAMTMADLESWLKDVGDTALADAFARYLASPSPHAARFIEKWTKKKDEWAAATAWHTAAAVASMNGGESGPYDDAKWRELLAEIEAKIHASPNRARANMNTALIAIGARSDALAKVATAAAKRIGKVEVDHGDTCCKTTDAAEGIAKARAHRAARRS